MGADLITATLYYPTEETLDWDAGKAAIDTLEMRDVNNYIENFLMDYAYEGATTDDEEEEAYMSVVKARLREVVDEIADSVKGYTRCMNTFTALGHTFIVVGDMSWGDTPELVDEFSILYCVPKVMRAIGFTVEGG